MWQNLRRSLNGEVDDKELLKRLRRSQEALQATRFRVGAVMLLVAFATGILATLHSVKCQASHCMFLKLDDDTPSPHFFFLLLEQGVLELLFVGRLMLLGLAPLADDARLTRLVLLWDAYVFIQTRVAMYMHSKVMVGDDFFAVFVMMSYHGRGIAFVACAAWAVVQVKPQRVQSLMWTAVAVYAVMNGVDKVVHVAYEAVRFRRLSCCVGQIFAEGVALYIVWSPGLRQSMHAKVLHRLQGRVAVRAAVTIACLIGGTKPCEAVAQAKARFRAVSVGELAFEDVKESTPDASLRELSAPVELGQCDAFVSHSWHDDPKAKWEALQVWRADFLKRRGREPFIWFDKVCIDQNNIELDLRCLPIFLNGCSRLVMLCGATYLKRLWCITELFAYVHMGCKIEQIELVPVLRESKEDEDLDEICDAFSCFDVRMCECFKLEDKERMIMAINTAFGCMDNFNGVVRKMSRRVTKTSTLLSRSQPADADIDDLESPWSSFSSGGFFSDEEDEDEEASDDGENWLHDCARA
eukprot:CAMPEP_0175402582 /NCGR_PEP_ID=MMETSP0095-20121207/37592_1 /TAXON_ID=311494 /ORGANISM="Alexandrium monilatum, Strain CCMP3105" /LENGTH=524 /DNA_ID=CAMNT_0016701355 /DNA_START=1 /DNA_END=1575 /DNA_ORIENTATION=-